MNRLVLGVCTLLFASASALAAEQEARGLYAGGWAGTASLEDDGLFDGANFDDSGTSYGIYGGYKFFRYLAVEARLSNLGSYSVGFQGFSEDIDVTGLSAHVVGIIPFGASGWELFGQLGLGSVNIDAGGADEDNSVGSAGIGLRFYPNPPLGSACRPTCMRTMKKTSATPLMWGSPQPRLAFTTSSELDGHVLQIVGEVVRPYALTCSTGRANTDMRPGHAPGFCL